MAEVTVDAEVFAMIGHKLILAISAFEVGFHTIATELETGQLSRSEVARQVRALATYTTATVKDLSR